jgi:hypothetical protein
VVIVIACFITKQRSHPDDCKVRVLVLLKDNSMNMKVSLALFPILTLTSSLSHRLLEITNGIEEAGGLRWELFGLLILAWVIVYLCIFKGVKSTGKVRVHSLPATTYGYSSLEQ